MRIDLGPARLVSGRPGGLGGRASLRGRAGPALAGGFERRWAGSTDIFKVLSNCSYQLVCSCVRTCLCLGLGGWEPPAHFFESSISVRAAGRRPVKAGGGCPFECLLLDPCATDSSSTTRGQFYIHYSSRRAGEAPERIRDGLHLHVEFTCSQASKLFIRNTQIPKQAIE